MSKKIFEIEWDRKFQQDKINDVISQLKNNLIKVRELPTEVKWCECGEPKLFYVESAQCSLCYKFLNPMSKGGITNTKIGIPIKPQPKLEVPKKIKLPDTVKPYAKSTILLKDKINEIIDYLKSKEETQ